jgi:osmotically inducible lipoprotein OsmB
MNRTILIAGLCVTVIGLSACGYNQGDRTLSGAGIGAGVGLVGGALVGAPLEGALIGGVVGAGTGVLTDPNQVNLGRPLWR